MKFKIRLLFLLGCFTACHHSNAADSIPGWYISKAEGTFSQSIDTLKITFLEGHHYRIERKSSIRESVNGKLQPPHYRFSSEEWLFDESTATLNNPKNGRQISFYPKQQILKLGKRIFRKIKPHEIPQEHPKYLENDYPQNIKYYEKIYGHPTRFCDDTLRFHPQRGGCTTRHYRGHQGWREKSNQSC